MSDLLEAMEDAWRACLADASDKPELLLCSSETYYGGKRRNFVRLSDDEAAELGILHLKKETLMSWWSPYFGMYDVRRVKRAQRRFKREYGRAAAAWLKHR